MTDAFEEIVGHLEYPMFVVAAAADGDADACLVGFTSQCSMDPPRFGVFLSKANHTYDLAVASEVLVVHRLRADQHLVAEHFGGKSAYDDPGKLEGCAVDARGPRARPSSTTATGSPAGCSTAPTPVTTCCSCSEPFARRVPGDEPARFAGVVRHRRRAPTQLTRRAAGRRLRCAAMTPEFHLYLPQMRLTMDAMVEKARVAEAAGFIGMAGMDHLAPPLAEQHDMFEALTTNAWLLANTERLVQGQLVLCDAFRHPAILAREAVTLDHASGGRFELGIGWGSVVEEFTTYGVRPTEARERVARSEGDARDRARALDRRDARLRGRVVPARSRPGRCRRRSRHIPIVIGGTGPKTMELVAEHADWWNVPVHQLDRLDEMRDRAGDARVSIQRMYTFAPEGSDRAAIEEAAQKRFGYSSRVVGGSSEMLDHFHAMQEQGVERFYVWFTDFAADRDARGVRRRDHQLVLERRPGPSASIASGRSS